MVGGLRGNAVSKTRPYRKTSKKGMENIRKQCASKKPPQVILQETWSECGKDTSKDLKQIHNIIYGLRKEEQVEKFGHLPNLAGKQNHKI